MGSLHTLKVVRRINFGSYRYYANVTLTLDEVSIELFVTFLKRSL